MRALKIIFWVVWRIWFYILVAVPILVMFPFLFLSILKERWYPYFFILARIWAKVILYGMGFRYQVRTSARALFVLTYLSLSTQVLAQYRTSDPADENDPYATRYWEEAEVTLPTTSPSKDLRPF